MQTKTFSLADYDRRGLAANKAMRVFLDIVQGSPIAPGLYDAAITIAQANYEFGQAAEATREARAEWEALDALDAGADAIAEGGR